MLTLVDLGWEGATEPRGYIHISYTLRKLRLNLVPSES